MRSTFESARELQPAIVFLDEPDSIGDRTKFSGSNVGYQTQVVNALLECIDGVDGRQGVVVVAATNFPEAVDRALLRSGRIERHVRMDLPDAEERAEILRFHLRLSTHDEALRNIATDLRGWSGSDLEKLAREARRLARADGGRPDPATSPRPCRRSGHFLRKSRAAWLFTRAGMPWLRSPFSPAAE